MHCMHAIYANCVSLINGQYNKTNLHKSLLLIILFARLVLFDAFSSK